MKKTLSSFLLLLICGVSGSTCFGADKLEKINDEITDSGRRMSFIIPKVEDAIEIFDSLEKREQDKLSDPEGKTATIYTIIVNFKHNGETDTLEKAITAAGLPN